VASLTTTAVPGATAYDCAGYYGGACEEPLPRWRHTLRLTWNAPGKVDVSLAWRYIAPVTVSAASLNPVLSSPYDPADARLGARSYFDIGVVWRLNRRLTLRGGVNNLFDTDPPVVGRDATTGVTTNANTYPGLYDSLGRFLFMGLTAAL